MIEDPEPVEWTPPRNYVMLRDRVSALTLDACAIAWLAITSFLLWKVIQAIRAA